MKKNIIFISLFCVLFVFSGCSLKLGKKMTPLEIQTIQSREYENTKEIVFASVMSVLQDIGYSIINANLNTGLISAESAASSNFLSKMWFGITEVEQTKATAFIEQIGSKIKVRLNFVETTRSSSGEGQSDREDRPILNQKIYQSTFDRIENAIFIRSNS